MSQCTELVDAPAPLGSFRFVSSESSRFKAPAEASSGFNKCLARSAPKRQPGAPNRVLAQDTKIEQQSCLPPLVPPGDLVLQKAPEVLIIGSAPSVDSLAKQQYYGHKMNHFWPVVSSVFQLYSQLPQGQAFSDLPYAERVNRLWQAGVIVWDVCQQFVRPGSSDSALQCMCVNPVQDLLVKYPTIHTVGLNGQTAHKLFVKHIVKAGKLPRAVRYVCLPSTSPLHAMKDAVSVKANIWRDALAVGPKNCFELNCQDVKNCEDVNCEDTVVN